MCGQMHQEPGVNQSTDEDRKPNRVKSERHTSSFFSRPQRHLLRNSRCLQESNLEPRPLSILWADQLPKLLIRRAGFLILNLQIIHDLLHV
jgi:hypothetical protein